MTRRTAGRIRNPLPPALIGLTMVSGILDAISFLGLGKIFLAMMTGNVIFLGLAVTGAQGFSGPAPVLAIAAFATGIVLAGRTERIAVRHARRHWLFPAMTVEITLLATAAVLAFLTEPASSAPKYTIIALLALAMGARCATVRRLAVRDLTITVGLTGALIALVHDSTLTGGRNTGALRRVGAVLAMGVGAIIGAVLMSRCGLPWALASVAALVAVITAAVRIHPAAGHLTDRTLPDSAAEQGRTDSAAERGRPRSHRGGDADRENP